MAGLRLLAWGLCVLAVLRPGAAAAHLGDINVDVEQPIATTSDYFVCATLDWWPPEKCDYGTCAWGNASLLNLDLSNKILLNAVSAFSPLVLRLGGTLQDKVFYATGGEQRVPCVPFAKNDSELFGFTQGCLTVARWDELHAFFKKSGAKVVFGLNALSRVSHVVGSGSDWDITNSASLIRYTVDKGYEIYGWELGNELGGKSIGALIPADQYASDVSFLTGFVDDVYQGSPSKPLVIAPGSFYEAGWFGDFITRTSPDMVGAVTHHIYSLGAGVDPEIMTRILDPRYLDGMASTFRDLQGLLKTAGTSAVAWVGEAGGAYNSGHHLVTDAFVFSFWFLDQLAMSAKYDTKTYCRQSLIGGNYGLLNTTTFEPNPDYYSALLWHRLMGTRVLDTEYNGTTNKIRAYAHCAKQSGGITLLLINLHGNAHNHVSLPHEATDALAEAAGATREEYHLTPGGGNIQSQVMMLNGRALVTDVDGNIPTMEPITVDAALDIVMAPLSIVFAHLPDYYAPACS